jgi:hypothetical protein
MMSKVKTRVPHYTPIEWAQMKARNGYALTKPEKWLLGQVEKTPKVQKVIEDRD